MKQKTKHCQTDEDLSRKQNLAWEWHKFVSLSENETIQSAWKSHRFLGRLNRERFWNDCWRIKSDSIVSELIHSEKKDSIKIEKFFYWIFYKKSVAESEMIQIYFMSAVFIGIHDDVDFAIFTWAVKTRKENQNCRSRCGNLMAMLKDDLELSWFW